MSTPGISQAPETRSLRASLLSLEPAVRAEVLAGLSDEHAAALLYDWRGLWARDPQVTPQGEWRTWLLLAGRGFGKTRVGAEWVREQVESGKARRIALVARSAADIRDVMVEGESGILAVSPPWNKPKYEPSKRRLTWPNGAIATTYSADEPNLLRGPQHDAAWADERAAWRYDDAWDQLMFGLRLGSDPRCVVTTTPRPTKAIKELIADSGTFVTRGSTYDNRANLAKAFLEKIVKKYEGTRLGRQELNAEILEDTEGALWTMALIEASRVAEAPAGLVRIVVGVDPAVTSGESSNETGIVICGQIGR
ncbi:MAG TPA: terminase family protein, partial [Vulgatibacter sp.]